MFQAFSAQHKGQTSNTQHPTQPHTLKMPTSRAKITLKDEELVKMLQKHHLALQEIQNVGKDQQGSLETKLSGLLLEMGQKTGRMSHKVLAAAFKKAKLMKIDVEATCLKLIHAWTNVLEKLKNKKTGVGLTLLQKEFEKVRMTAEGGDADPTDAGARDADTTDAGPMEEEKATNDPARLIHILHDSMEAKIVADGKSHMVPLVPGEKGLAVVKWHGEILQTLVSNKTLPASRLLEMSPMQVTASPAGSSTYPLVEIMEAWEDGEPDQAPQCIKDEDMDQDAEGPDQAPQCMDQDAEAPDQDAEEPDQEADEPDQDAAGADQDGEEADQDAELASDQIQQRDILDQSHQLLQTPCQKTKAAMGDSTKASKASKKEEVQKKPAGQQTSTVVAKKPGVRIAKKPAANKVKEHFKKTTECPFRTSLHRLMWYRAGNFLAIRQIGGQKKQLVSCKSSKSQEKSYQIGMALIRELEQGAVAVSDLKGLMTERLS